MTTTTAQWIFETTMQLTDNLDDSGKADTEDNREYKDRTLGILNMLRGELFPYSDTFKDFNAAADDMTYEKQRPISFMINDFESVIYLDDYICQTILPYGLAAHLLADENPTIAGFFQQRYDELKQKLMIGMPVESEDIEDVYSHGRSVIGFEWTTRW